MAEDKYNLRRMKRSQLIEIIYALQQNEQALRAKVEELDATLADRNLAISNAGSIAEASLNLSGIFEDAQKAADQYLASVRNSARGAGLSERQESLVKQAEERADQIVKNAREEAARIMAEAKANKNEAERGAESAEAKIVDVDEVAPVEAAPVEVSLVEEASPVEEANPVEEIAAEIVEEPTAQAAEDKPKKSVEDAMLEALGALAVKSEPEPEPIQAEEEAEPVESVESVEVEEPIEAETPEPIESIEATEATEAAEPAEPAFSLAGLPWMTAEDLFASYEALEAELAEKVAAIEMGQLEAIDEALELDEPAAAEQHGLFDEPVAPEESAVSAEPESLIEFHDLSEFDDFDDIDEPAERVMPAPVEAEAISVVDDASEPDEPTEPIQAVEIEQVAEPAKAAEPAYTSNATRNFASSLTSRVASFIEDNAKYADQAVESDLFDLDAPGFTDSPASSAYEDELEDLSDNETIAVIEDEDEVEDTVDEAEVEHEEAITVIEDEDVVETEPVEAASAEEELQSSMAAAAQAIVAEERPDKEKAKKCGVKKAKSDKKAKSSKEKQHAKKEPKAAKKASEPEKKPIQAAKAPTKTEKMPERTASAAKPAAQAPVAATRTGRSTRIPVRKSAFSGLSDSGSRGREDRLIGTSSARRSMPPRRTPNRRAARRG